MKCAGEVDIQNAAKDLVGNVFDSEGPGRSGRLVNASIVYQHSHRPELGFAPAADNFERGAMTDICSIQAEAVGRALL
jgi:hypothetical protein